MRFRPRGQLIAAVWLLLSAVIVSTVLTIVLREKSSIAVLESRGKTISLIAQDGSHKPAIWEYYPHSTHPKSLITGDDAKPVGGSLNVVAIINARLEAYELDGQTNMIASSPECDYNMATHAAASTSHLHAWTVDQRMAFEGDDWMFSRTNSTLYISNNVSSRFEKQLFLSQAGPTNAIPGMSNQFVFVYSDHFYFNNLSNQMLYTGNVRVDDPEMYMTCPLMDIKLRTAQTNQASLLAPHSTNGIERIVCDGGVVATNKANGSRVTGQRAVYAGDQGRTLLTVTGQPHWFDGPRESDGEVFVYDPEAKWWRAERNAHLKIPRRSMGQFGMLSASGATNAVGANEMVDAYADTFLFQLPPMNGPVQSILGQTNVVILDPQNHGRATGGRLFYNETNGIALLQENPFWHGDQGSVKGDEFIYDRTNQIFTSRGHSDVLLYVHGMNGATTNNAAKASTNQFVRGLSDVFEYQGDWLRFKDNVRARYVGDGDDRGRISSDRLDVQYSSNQVHRVIGDGQVVANQLLFTNKAGAELERELRAEHLDVHVRTNSLLENVFATGNVDATERARRKGAPQPVVTTLDSEMAALDFMPGTNVNTVETMIAEQNVEITRDAMRTLGDKAVYSGSNEVMRVTGSPTNLPVLFRTNGTFISRVIVYDLKTESAAFEGYQSITGDLPARTTNHVRMTNQPAQTGKTKTK